MGEGEKEQTDNPAIIPRRCTQWRMVSRANPRSSNRQWSKNNLNDNTCCSPACVINLAYGADVTVPPWPRVVGCSESLAADVRVMVGGHRLRTVPQAVEDLSNHIVIPHHASRLDSHAGRPTILNRYLNVTTGSLPGMGV